MRGKVEIHEQEVKLHGLMVESQIWSLSSPS